MVTKLMLCCTRQVVFVKVPDCEGKPYLGGGEMMEGEDIELRLRI